MAQGGTGGTNASGARIFLGRDAGAFELRKELEDVKSQLNLHNLKYAFYTPKVCIFHLSSREKTWNFQNHK